MSLPVLSDTNSQLLRAKLSRALATIATASNPGNDVLNICPISSLGIFCAVVGLACLMPTLVGDPANPYAILLEWILFPTFQITRVIKPKLLGIIGIAVVPILLTSLPLLESLSRFPKPHVPAKKQAKMPKIYWYKRSFRTRQTGLKSTIFECFYCGRKLRLAPVYIGLQNG